MKKILLSTIAIVGALAVNGQTQIGNSDMEIWEDVGSATESPENWSGIKEATGNTLFISFAPQAITRSTDTHTGSGYSARLEAKNALGNTANGTMTCGQLNVGSTTPSDPSNHAKSHTSGTEFSEACTDAPDSIVWWAKFTGAVATDSARMKATLHDTYDYQDPEDATSSLHVVATAVENYVNTNGWVRMSAPFVYSGPLALGTQTHLLVTFTTHKTPGGGTIGDLVFIDDVELIYNPAGPVDTDGDGVLDDTELIDGTDDADFCDYLESSVTETPSGAWDAADCDSDGVANGSDAQPLVGLSEVNTYGLVVSMDNNEQIIHVTSKETFAGSYAIYNMMGQAVQNGVVANEIPFEAKPGVYFIHLNDSDRTFKFEILKF